MNILILLFLPAVAHGEPLCPQHMVEPVQVQAVAANRNGLSRHGHGITGKGATNAFRTKQSDDAADVARVGTDDMLFYLSSHAQALGDTSGPGMTPWLELRPIGAVEQDALAGSGTARPAFSEHACEQSAAQVPASGAASYFSDV